MRVGPGINDAVDDQPAVTTRIVRKYLLKAALS
jgi:hypothetical protein